MIDLIGKIRRFTANPDVYISHFLIKHAKNILPDKTAIKCLYRLKMNRKLDLRNPVTFTEKIQWIKLYERDSRYTELADKYLAKEYVGNIIGQEHIIPLLGVWDNASDIDFESLPDQFVLKCNHDSHSRIICKDKSSLDIASVRSDLEKNLKRDYYKLYREWSYKNIDRKIIAEVYLEDPEDRSGFIGLKDYKFFCMNGKPEIMFITHDIDAMSYFDAFDMNFEHLDLFSSWNDPVVPCKPSCYSEMIDSARVLSEGFPFVRVDFYVTGDKYYFGEMTFYPMAGYLPGTDGKWDRLLGDKIRLPKR